MQTTTIRWRAVNVSRDTTTYGASCIGHGLNSARCGAPVAWCRQWQTSEMAAPAFWYYCDEHGYAAAADDGMTLERNALHAARRERAAAVPSAQLEPELGWTPDVDPDSVPVDSVPVSDSVRSDSVRESETRNSETQNPYAVGSIWHTSWGYDQTNVEFYTVVRETAASVWLVPMGSTIRDGRQWPTTTTGIAKPELHRKPRDAYGIEHPYLTLDYVRSAWPYTGGGEYSTAASGGAGH